MLHIIYVYYDLFLNKLKTYVYTGISMTCAWTFSHIFRGSYSSRKVSFFSRVSSAALTAGHSVPLVALQIQIVFPLRFVATRDVRHWRARDSEVRNEVVTRLHKPRDSLVRDGVTRRVREAAFFIFRRPPRFATVLSHLSDGSAVSLSHVDNRLGTWWPRGETEGFGQERNSDLGAQRDLDVRTEEESGGYRLSRERRNIPTVYTAGNAILAYTLT